MFTYRANRAVIVYQRKFRKRLLNQKSFFYPIWTRIIVINVENIYQHLYRTTILNRYRIAETLLHILIVCDI